MIMRIKALREAAGLTQVQLASAMGTIQNVVSAWESERALPRSRQLPLLAYVLGVEIGDLFEPFDPNTEIMDAC